VRKSKKQKKAKSKKQKAKSKKQKAKSKKQKQKAKSKKQKAKSKKKEKRTRLPKIARVSPAPLDYVTSTCGFPPFFFYFFISVSVPFYRSFLIKMQKLLPEFNRLSAPEQILLGIRYLFLLLLFIIFIGD
jgi:hypothetical protein